LTAHARVVLDADFLSAFLKIEQLPLAREFFGVEDFLFSFPDPHRLYL